MFVGDPEGEALSLIVAPAKLFSMSELWIQSRRANASPPGARRQEQAPPAMGVDPPIVRTAAVCVHLTGSFFVANRGSQPIPYLDSFGKRAFGKRF